MAEIYNHYNSESFDHFIGHMSNDGVVYNHWQKESLTYAVGHVRSGIVYNHHSNESTSYAIGHIGRNGVVYNHYDKESLDYAIGHVDSNGVVYDHWESESLSHAIGHVRGGSVYAAGAAFLLLNASLNGPVVDGPPPTHEEEWRRERAEHEAQMQRSRNRKMIQAAKMQSYKNNPKIAAAANEYAQQRAKTATIVVPILFTMLCIPGFKDITGDTIIPVIAIVGLFVLMMTLFIRHKTYKNAFEQKVWELGESGYGLTSQKQSNTKKKSAPKPTPKAEPKPTPMPKPTSVPKPAPDPKPQPTESKIVVCPYCGAKCQVPAGNGKIRLTCPNPACRQQYEIDT